MSKYKLTFKLKQHTPIIHFQHDQHGATLRATELKPKLDRFLIKKLGLTTGTGDNERLKDEYKSWFINQGKEHLALDYKVRVEPIIEKNIKYYLPLPTKLNSRSYPNKEQNFKTFLLSYISFDFEYLSPTPYFANSDKVKFHRRSENVDEQSSKPDEINFAIYTTDEIDVRVSSFNEEILKVIKENITEFFLLNNFGTRQNKGFGSYTVETIDNKKVSDEVVNELLKTNFIKKSNKQTNIKKVFSFILEEYQLLKSGINIPFGRNPVYKKSKLFKYFIKKNIRWEKRFIKQRLNKNGVVLIKTHDPIDYDNASRNYYNNFIDRQENDYKYIRALLGLAENFEFSTNAGRIKVKIKSNNGSIERFKSPLFFKVIDNIIYLKTDETYKAIEGKSFEFLYNGSLGTLIVPGGFDLNEFIKNHLSNNWINT